MKSLALLVLSACAWSSALSEAATAVPLATPAGDPQMIFADGFETPPPLNAPPVVDAGTDQTITLPAAASLLGSVSDDGLPVPPGAVATGWSKFSGPGSVEFDNPAAAITSATFSLDGVYMLRLSANDGALAAFDDVEITVNPQGPPVFEPAEVDPTATTTLFDSTQFLYTGPNPVQTGVAPGTLHAGRTSVLRGRVLDRDELPLAGVTVAIHERPEFGQTQTRDDGWFDLAVNGGGLFTVNYVKPGLLPLQRTEPVEWREFVILPDVVMIPLDPLVTAVAANAPAMQVHQGSSQSDDDGERRATLLFPPGTGASMVLGDGSLQPLASLDVRATEYTVGPGGPAAMPGLLPPTSGYTYAVELSVDQALAAGATSVEFTQPVSVYVDNFLDFPAGTVVPAGYYHRAAARWVAMPNGLVIKLLSVTLGAADLDIDGDDVADDPDTELTPLGITLAEREQLALLFDPGQSFWRTPAQHFSAWDYNWPRKWPDDATGAGTNGVASNKTVNKCLDEAYGSIIECQNQILGQSVGITGTPYTLNYRTDRVPGWEFGRTIDVAASGPAVPASLKRIEVQVEVAGQQMQQILPPQPGQQAKFVWDGKDAYGRTLQGRHSVKGSLDFVYDAVYVESPEGLAAAFAQIGTTPISYDPAREEIRFPQALSGQVGLMDARALGVGGWTLSIHHSYDPNARTLYLGTGERISAEHMPMTLSRATSAANSLPAEGLTYLEGLAVAPDGGFYFINSNPYDLAIRESRIYHVDTAGLITLVAGSGGEEDTGDGDTALAAGLYYPHSLALGPDGSLYVATLDRIRRIDPAGIITTVAGGGDTLPVVDGTLATAAAIRPEQIAVAADGTIYFADLSYNPPTVVPVIYRVGVDGIIARYAGGGTVGDGGGENPANNVPALDANLDYLKGGLTLDDAGNLYFLYIYNWQIFARIDSAGMLTNTGITYYGSLDDETWPPIGSDFGIRYELSLDASGALIAADKSANRVRRIELHGVMTTIAGGGTLSTLDPVDGIPAPAADIRVTNARVAPDGSLILMENERYIWDQPRQQLLRARSAMPDPLGLPYTIASPAGDVLYQFDAQGRHLRTRHALTGSVLYEFGYDGAGRLTSVTEKTGGTDNVTQIQRDGAGHPTAILAPFGQVTELNVDANGFVDHIENPANEVYAATYNAGGLVQTFTKPGNRTSAYQYETDGRLKQADDAADGTQLLGRTELPTGHQVTRTTSLGRTTEYRVENPAGGERKFTTVLPDTHQVVAELFDTGELVVSDADGAVLTASSAPDPRFSMQAAFTQNSSTVLPSTLTVERETTRTAFLSDPENVLSLAVLNETSSVAGNSWSTTFTASTRKFVTTSPLGRSRTLTLDVFGRPVSLQASGGLATTTSYDSRGRPLSVTTGSGPTARTMAFTYDAQGLPDTFTDQLDRVVTMERDALGRMVRKELPDGDAIEFGYNAAGDLVSIMPPGRPAHTFAYDSLGRVISITPPAVAGSGPTTFTYDDDRALLAVEPPGESVSFTYDAAGRVSTMVLDIVSGPQGDYLFTYDDTTGRLTSVDGPGGAAIDYSYDGSLITGVFWSGPVTGSLELVHDARLAVATEIVNGTSAVSFTHNADDRLVAAGDLVITRNSGTGLPGSTTLGVVSDTWTYDAFGAVATYAVVANGSPVYAEGLEYDALGRINQKVETIGGSTVTFDYSYDAKGQLVEVQYDNVVAESYVYDPNGNRTAATVDGSSITATYDVQDRLLSYGPATFAHTASGRLATRTTPGGTTTYSYDAAGALLAVDHPVDPDITYQLDTGLRRVARDVDGVAAERFLYSGSRPIAQLDDLGNLVSRYVYAGGVAPAYMIHGGVAYRLITDHAGSVRLVVNASDGTIAQQLDYDSFGRVLEDTNPGFQPFGFAGGLYDHVTGLVRFDARDYDASTGRWTDKDPLGFAGIDTNLYRYVGNDPVNRIDPEGLSLADALAGAVAGLVDVAMWQQSLAHAASSLAALATEAILGEPQPAPADPNQVVGVLEMSNEIAADFFDAQQSLIDTGSDAFSIARFCTGLLGDLGVGIGIGVTRGASSAAGSSARATGSARNVSRTSDPAYRPLASGQQGRTERLAAENQARAAREQPSTGRPAAEDGVELRGREEGAAWGRRRW